MSNATCFDSLCYTPALIGCQFKTGKSGWTITCIANGGQSSNVQSSLENWKRFNFQNLITEKGTQLALGRTVFTLCLHCLFWKQCLEKFRCLSESNNMSETRCAAVCNEIIRHHGNTANRWEHLTNQPRSQLCKLISKTKFSKNVKKHPSFEGTNHWGRVVNYLIRLIDWWQRLIDYKYEPMGAALTYSIFSPV